MSNEKSVFAGKWITTEEFAGLKPVNVFHRQLDPAPEPKGGIENRHILFRKKFALSGPVAPPAPAFIRITADDYYAIIPSRTHGCMIFHTLIVSYCPDKRSVFHHFAHYV
jgi:hypothetical protein